MDTYDPFENGTNPIAEDPRARRPIGEKQGRFSKPVKTTYEQARDFNAGKGVAPKPRLQKVDHNKRCRDYWTDHGYTYIRADYYDGHAGRTKDFLGVFDAIAMRPDKGVVGIQLTTYDHRGERRKKMLASSLCRKWVQCGGKAVILSYKQEKNGRYTPFLEKITLEDF